MSFSSAAAPAPSIQSASRAAVDAIRSGVLPVTTRVVTAGGSVVWAVFWAVTDSVTGACSIRT